MQQFLCTRDKKTLYLLDSKRLHAFWIPTEVQHVNSKLVWLGFGFEYLPTVPAAKIRKI